MSLTNVPAEVQSNVQATVDATPVFASDKVKTLCNMSPTAKAICEALNFQGKGKIPGSISKDETNIEQLLLYLFKKQLPASREEAAAFFSAVEKAERGSYLPQKGIFKWGYNVKNEARTMLGLEPEVTPEQEAKSEGDDSISFRDRVFAALPSTNENGLKVREVVAAIKATGFKYKGDTKMNIRVAMELQHLMKAKLVRRQGGKYRLAAQGERVRKSEKRSEKKAVTKVEQQSNIVVVRASDGTELKLDQAQIDLLAKVQNG